MAVSYDDAWNNQIIETSKPSISAKIVDVLPIAEPPAQSKPSVTFKRAHRPTGHTVRRRRVESMDSESDSDDDTCHTSLKIQKEMRDLRSMYENNLYVSNAILYTSVAIVIILLVTVFHTQSRLHYTTECLLWCLKSSKIA